MTGGIELAPLITKLVVDIDGFKKQMDKASQVGVKGAEEIGNKIEKTANIGKKLSSVGGSLTKFVSLPLKVASVAVGKLAVDFETSFAKVSTLLDSSTTDFDQYKKDIIKASSESGIAVDEFSDSLYNAMSAGVASDKAIQFTNESMKLAKGGFTSGANAVDVLTTAINGYGLKAEEANKVSDMLIATQNLGKTTVDELSQSMGKVIPVANSVNFSMDELSASYAQLTYNGIATSEAGTYINGMLSELGTTGSKADKALRELSGKSFADLKKQGTSTTDVLKMLETYAQKNGLTLKDMFGQVTAGTAALVLSKNEGKEYSSMLEKIQDSAGSTQKAFDTMSATPMERMKKALNELKNGAIQLGAELLPIVSKITEKLAKLASAFNNLSPEGRKTILVVGGIVASIGPLLMLVGKGITLFASFQGAMTALTAKAVASGTTVTAMLSGILIPIGAVIAIIGVLFVAWKYNFGGIQEKTQEIFEKIKTIITTVMDFLKMAWENDLMGIKTICETVWNAIEIVFSTVFQAISDIFDIFSALFSGDWEALWEAIWNFVSNLWNNILSFIGTILDGIVTAIISIGVSLWGAITSAFSSLWEGLKSIWNSITSWFSQAINDPVGTVKGIGSALWDAGASIFSSLWDGIKSVWSGISDWVGGKVNWLKDKVMFWKKGKEEIDGSHYNGLSYVPFDGYTARLHKGERVLTAKENQALTQGKGISEGESFTLKIDNFINNRTQDVRDLAKELEMYRKQLQLV